MLYWEILAGFVVFLALCWTWAMLVSDGEGGKASKLERLVVAAEDVARAYNNYRGR